eukprot:COSAG02_NODE_39_length_48074_cov_106.508890_11_plen_86_part_00
MHFCMQTYYYSNILLEYRAVRYRYYQSDPRLLRSPRRHLRPRGRPAGDFFSQAPGNPGECLLDFCADSEGMSNDNGIGQSVMQIS